MRASVKDLFHVPTYRVIARDNHVNILSTNQVPQFVSIRYRDLDYKMELLTDLTAHLPKWGSTTGLYALRGSRGPKASSKRPQSLAACPAHGCPARVLLGSGNRSEVTRTRMRGEYSRCPFVGLANSIGRQATCWPPGL